MRFSIMLFTILFSGIAMAESNFVNFSGNWNGTCTFNGRTVEKNLVIEQNDGEKIEVTGRIFNLNKTTPYDFTDEYNGHRYREVTAYDFKWDDTATEIVTSVKWLGWYLDKNGTWSGEGTGRVYLSEGTLHTQRSYSGTFGSGEEACEYRPSSHD
jgi:hypothetical protein